MQAISFLDKEEDIIMKGRKKKGISIVLVLVLIFGVFPMNLAEKNEVKAGSDYGISNPCIEKVTLTEWDCIYFGNYWQNDTNGDGIANKNDKKEPIKWRILSQNGDDVFLLADQNLDCQIYDEYSEESTDVTWENCALRKWLNEDFYNDAFSNEEKNSIQTTEVVNEDNPEYGTEGGNNTKDKI